MKVLVADDSQPIRQRLVERLARLPGVSVFEAVDTPSALKQMKTVLPDVAVLDIRMPGGGGIVALDEIKKVKPDTTVIIMTNYPYAQYRRKCLDAGADFFFDKSTEFEQVAETVRQVAKTGKPGEVARRTAAAQLVTAKEELEKANQRKHDMGILSLLRKPAADGLTNDYGMWEKTFDAMPDLVAIFDADQRIIRVNKAAADHLGVSVAELTGKKCYEYFHGTNCPVSGCPHTVMLEDFKEHSAELYDEHMGGWFDVSVSPILEKDHLIGVIHVARDITARKQAEILAQSTLDALSAHICIVDETGEILSVNRSWEEFAIENQLLCGSGRGENYLAICDAAVGLHSDEAKQFAKGLRDVLRGDADLFEMEYPCETKIKQLWFCGRVTPFQGEGSRMAAIAHEDVTARKLAENAVKQSERDLRYVMDAIRDGLWDWDIEKDVIKCSPQSYRMLGYEPDEIPMSYVRLEQITHPDDWAQVEEAIRAYFCGETDQYDVEFRLRCKDGAYSWVRVRGSLVERTAGGEPFRMMGIQSNIDEKRQAESALRESELRYRQLFESMQTGFALHEIICDEKGAPCDYRFLEVNAAFEALTGLKAENLVGRTVKEVLPETEPVWIETYGRVAVTGRSARIEDFSSALGRHYSVSAYSPCKGQFAVIFTDITEQKTAEATVRHARDVAEEANRAKTQFLANMSHELRTPLNAIIGLTELLEDSELDEEQRDYIQTIGSSGEALLAIISDLLDLSKIEMGKLEIKEERFSIRKVVETSIALLVSLSVKKGVKLSADIDSDVPEIITGDSDRLQQVLINLLNNALKFTGQGFVRLSVHCVVTPSGSRRIEFSVEDSGEGMDEVTMERIFEPFQQGDNSSTREHGGVGLGLAISKNLVEMMGGVIRVESHVGQGSHFSFYLMEPAPQTTIPVAEVRDAWRGKCVCVWGDDPADMRTAEVLLERCGVLPRYADSLSAIYDRLTSDVEAEVVLCNLDMPDLAEKLLELRGLRSDIPWIGFSNWEVLPDAVLQNCFSVFIDRPLKSGQLYEALLRVAANS